MGLVEQVNALLKSLREKDEEITKLKKVVAYVYPLHFNLKTLQKNKRRAYKERYNKLVQMVEAVLIKIRDI